MNNNSTWFESFVLLGAGLFLLLITALFISFANPRIDQKCAAKGGQVLHTPGHLNSCIYPAK